MVFPERGEIVAARTFSASGEPNPLAKKDRAATTLTVTGDKLVSAPEELWSPRSVLSVIDGLNSIRWCMILLKFGSEQVTHAFFDWLVKMARSRPQKTEQFGQFWLTVAWKLATELRGGQTFDAAVAPIMRDYDTFTECMSRGPQSTSKRSTQGFFQVAPGTAAATVRAWSASVLGPV